MRASSPRHHRLRWPLEFASLIREISGFSFSGMDRQVFDENGYYFWQRGHQ
jgi:hypothetical protein